jgi:hypothetical protein
MHVKIFLTSLVTVLLLAIGCAPTLDKPATTEPGETPPEGGKGLEQVETPEAGAPEQSSGETPPALFDLVLDDLLARSGGDRAAVEVLKSEAVVWSDGSLGCPQPGMMYTQATVSGYQVILALRDQMYDYHLSERGTFVLCENPLPADLSGEPSTE